MEMLFIYLIKSSGLIGLFYLAYIILLRKETFFNSNRWFLLAGLITSVVLPLVVFTKIVWVDPSPTNFDWSKIPVTTVAENDTFEITWYLVFTIVYSIGILVFLLKFACDYYSLSKVLKGKTIQQQADFKFIDLTENIAPFSYFNFIVYNSSLYSDRELENILEHEKVHSAQNHTVDVLVSRLFCVVFWFNPLVWLYKKAVVQNLEFIADSEASKNISDKKAYQLTLLKITTHENCVAITNHFYQSLIKKRIVMLNKNQSNKRSSWKYAMVLPLLLAFMFYYQVRVVAQEKKGAPTEKNAAYEQESVIYLDKNSTDAEMKTVAEMLQKSDGVLIKFSKIKRNSKGEITAIRIDYKDKIGEKGTSIIDGDEPIDSLTIFRTKNSIWIGSNDKKNEVYQTAISNERDVDLVESTNQVSETTANAPSVSTEKEIFINGSKKSQEDLDKLDPNEIESMDVVKKSDKGTIRVVTKNFSKMLNDNDIYINGEKVDKNELLVLDQNSIDKMDVNKNEKTIRITTKTVTQSVDKFDSKKISKLNPIIILDGKKTEANFDISNIDENQIETMKVLKGQNAMEKYGKDGENGVIEIITKKHTDILKSTNK